MLISNMYEKKLEKSCPIKSCFDSVQLELVVVKEVDADDREGDCCVHESPLEGAVGEASLPPAVDGGPVGATQVWAACGGPGLVWHQAEGGAGVH